MASNNDRWDREEIRPKLKVSKVNLTLASGYVTVVSAPISGHLRHIVNVDFGPDAAGSGDVNFGFAAVRASGTSGSEVEKHVFSHKTDNESIQWGGTNIQDEVIELRLGEELVGRAVKSGVDDMSSLWWEE